LFGANRYTSVAMVLTNTMVPVRSTTVASVAAVLALDLGVDALVADLALG
jgi:hypothetical protein